MSNHLSILIEAIGHEPAMKAKDALRRAGYTIYLGDASTEVERLRAALTKISDPLLVEVKYGTGTARALEIIVAMRDIAKDALAADKRSMTNG